MPLLGLYTVPLPCRSSRTCFSEKNRLLTEALAMLCSCGLAWPGSACLGW